MDEPSSAFLRALTLGASRLGSFPVLSRLPILIQPKTCVLVPPPSAQLGDAALAEIGHGLAELHYGFRFIRYFHPEIASTKSSSVTRPTSVSSPLATSAIASRWARSCSTAFRTGSVSARTGIGCRSVPSFRPLS